LNQLQDSDSSDDEGESGEEEHEESDESIDEYQVSEEGLSSDTLTWIHAGK